MGSHSNGKLAYFLVVALLPISSGAAGVLLAKSPPSGSRPVTPAVATGPATVPLLSMGNSAGAQIRTREFPDAATLQSLAAAGEIESTRLLTPPQLAALQCRIDRLNGLWESTTLRLHRRMASVTQELIEHGELQPTVALRHDTGGAVIGRRLTVQNGVGYEKAFYAGEDQQIDTLQHRCELLTHLADHTIQAAFH